MNSALQNSFQAAKSQENNANSQRTAADQQRHNGTTAQRHNGKANNTRESLHFNGNHEFEPPKQLYSRLDTHEVVGGSESSLATLVNKRNDKHNIRNGTNQLTVLLKLLPLLSSSFALSPL